MTEVYSILLDTNIILTADYTSAVRKNVYFCPWLLRVCGERKITKKD